MELTGKIIKGIAGFYYVNCEDDGTLHTYECKAKGGFRKDKIKPLVGDNVRIQVVSKEEKIGNIDFLWTSKEIWMSRRCRMHFAVSKKNR